MKPENSSLSWSRNLGRFNKWKIPVQNGLIYWGTSFHAARAPHAIEHLSGNGSAYIARDTRLFAQALNLTRCFTPVASPQSNGMSEAFVKTLKRDYTQISALPDAEAALKTVGSNRGAVD